MYLSYNHLKQLIDVPVDSKLFAKDLTERVVEVEGVEDWSKKFDKVVVGNIVEVQKHPNADKLKVCMVNIGKNSKSQISNHKQIQNSNDQNSKNYLLSTTYYPLVQVVCGGVNVREGLQVAVALPGAQVKWHGEKTWSELKESEIRGVKSFGMICSAEELDLPVQDVWGEETNHEKPNILDLSRFQLNVKPGALLARALGFDDQVLEIENKSMTHRGDLWGYLGVMREVEALYSTNKVEKYLNEIRNTTQSFDRVARSDDRAKFKIQNLGNIDVTIEYKDLCRRYIAFEIENVLHQESPWEVQSFLIKHGLRPINLVVDLTNYVMMEVGQPLHAFDKSKLTTHPSGIKLEVRRACKGEKIQTLDRENRELSEEDIVIADSEKAVAVAGVMGGENSEMDAETSVMILESASFHPIMVRKTASRLSLRSEASARFEKGLPVELAEIGAFRFLQLLHKHTPSVRVVSYSDVGSQETDERAIQFDMSWVENFIGNGIVSEKEALSILQKLGFESDTHGGVLIPWWRPDISIPADLAEEIARIHGYNTIPHRMPSFPIDPPMKDHQLSLLHELSDVLVRDLKFCETESYPFQIGTLADEKTKRIRIVNPKSPENAELRDSLLPNIVAGVIKNQPHRDSIRLFEIGRVFFASQTSEYRRGPKGEQMLPAQPFHACIAVSSPLATVFGIQGVVEQIGQALGFDFQFRPCLVQWTSPHTSLGVYLDTILVGYVGMVSAKACSMLGSKYPISIANLDVDILAHMPKQPKKFVSLPLFPSVLRDIALVADKTVTYQQIVSFLSKTPLLSSFELFDVFEGRGLPEGKRSLAFHLTFSSPERTLTSKDVDQALQKTLSTLEKKFGISLRS